MIKIGIILLTLATSTACHSTPLTQVNNFSAYPIVDNSMVSQAPITIINVTLLAREETQPPDGIPPQPNRDIGFATVFLRIENTQMEEATLFVKTIEIRNAYDDRLQSFSHPPETIQLKPLENAERALYLTNKTGYPEQGQVKAVVTYQIGDRVSVIESEPVTVDRY